MGIILQSCGTSVVDGGGGPAIDHTILSATGGWNERVRSNITATCVRGSGERTHQAVVI